MIAGCIKNYEYIQALICVLLFLAASVKVLTVFLMPASDGSKIGFTNGSHPDVLFKTRVNIAPGIDAVHQDGGKALMKGRRFCKRGESMKL
jgi:hypothetical protein